tara:strand:+ start:430 stop:591 length:162 start_codon:yes stop_codon:yes gene_type:complete
MSRKSKTRNGLIHLYNPKKEGLGSYDLNYINAYRKNKSAQNKLNRKNNQRYAA